MLEPSAAVALILACFGAGMAVAVFASLVRTGSRG